jgi:hypothetical protein
MTTHRLQLLDVEQEPAIALDQNELAVATLPACGSHAERVGESVSDRTELADRREPLRRPAAQLREPNGLVAGAADDVPILRDCAVEGAYRLAWVEQTGLDVEGRGVSGLSRDPVRQLLGADRGRSGFQHSLASRGWPTIVLVNTATLTLTQKSSSGCVRKRATKGVVAISRVFTPSLTAQQMSPTKWKRDSLCLALPATTSSKLLIYSKASATIEASLSTSTARMRLAGQITNAARA